MKPKEKNMEKKHQKLHKQGSRIEVGIWQWDVFYESCWRCQWLELYELKASYRDDSS